MQALPVIYITAETNYEVGKAIGRTFRGCIADYFNASKNVEICRRFYSHQEGRKIYDNYLNRSEQYFPEIVDEIRGIADGSGQTFVDIFLLQMGSEIRNGYQYEINGFETVNTPKENTSCTGVLVNRKGFRMIGFNNDWAANVAEYVYIGHVTIINEDGGHSVIKEKFVSFMYAGHLPGSCFGMNRGLVFAMNSLRPNGGVNREGIPSGIIFRKLLTCKTIHECADILENKPFGCAFGVNVNIAHVHDDVMCAMEAYQEESKTRVSIHVVEDTHYVHTNHYKHLDNVLENPTEGSYIRHQRAEEMMSSHPPTSGDDVRQIVGDTSLICGKEPIYRFPSEKHQLRIATTTASAVFDLTNQRLDIYGTNPKLAKQPCVSMDFLR